MSINEQNNNQSNSTLIITAFIFGALMLIVLFFAPTIMDCRPSNMVTKVILGLSAGGFAAGLTGSIISKRKGVTAAGGFAIFLIIFSLPVDSKDIFEKTQFPNCGSEQNSSTPEGLQNAIKSNNISMVKDLIKNGADPNLEIDSIGNNPIHLAAKNCNLALVNWLINNGADHTEANDEGKYANELIPSDCVNKSEISQILLNQKMRLHLYDNCMENGGSDRFTSNCSEHLKRGDPR